MTIQKSRIRETPNILTNEDSSKDATLRPNDQDCIFKKVFDQGGALLEPTIFSETAKPPRI